MDDCGCNGISLPMPANGVDGENAFTLTTSPFTQPAVLATVAVNTDDTGQLGNGFANKGQILRITDGSVGGWYEVANVVSPTQLSVVNLGYQGSSAPGVTIPSGSNVSPSGPAGVAGAAGAAGSAGAPGADGIVRLYEYLSTRLSTSVTGPSTWENISPAHSIPANTLVSDGDEVSLKYTSDINTASRGAFRRVMIDGTGVSMVSLTRSLGLPNEPSHESVGDEKAWLVGRTDVRLIRVNSTTLRAIATFDIYNSNGNATATAQKDIPGFDFTTQYDLYFEIQQLQANQVGLRTITMDLIKS